MAYPFSVIETQNLPVIQAIPHVIHACDGVQLMYYSFVPRSTLSAIVIFYHGAGMYSNNTYKWIGAQLQSGSSIGSYFVDTRGHGSSGGKRGDAPSKMQVWQDIDTFVDFVMSQHPGIPVYLVGHSAGAGLLLNYSAAFVNSAIAGYVFLSPYLGIESATLYRHGRQRRLAKKVKKVIYSIAHHTHGRFLGHVPLFFFNYPAEWLREDTLVLSSYTYTMLSAVEPQGVQGLFEQLRKPFALYIGQHDEQCIPEKVIAYTEYATYVQDYALAEIVPQAKHFSLLLQAPRLITQAIEHMHQKRAYMIHDQSLAPSVE